MFTMNEPVVNVVVVAKVVNDKIASIKVATAIFPLFSLFSRLFKIVFFISIFFFIFLFIRFKEIITDYSPPFGFPNPP